MAPLTLESRRERKERNEKMKGETERRHANLQTEGNIQLQTNSNSEHASPGRYLALLKKKTKVDADYNLNGFSL